jgi:hypothetical protein
MLINKEKPGNLPTFFSANEVSYSLEATVLDTLTAVRLIDLQARPSFNINLYYKDSKLILKCGMI